ncbi:hypothetical protein SH449x_003747 [Pirellulaceae bacterium SH449]
MEVASRSIDSASPKEHRSASAFEAEPREFQQWISDQNSDRRYRIDIPIECDNASTAEYSLYGICRPIRSAPALPIIPTATPSESEKRDRLVRLLERQQEWYDARELARLRAEQYLDIIDQHQQQWLNHQPSNRRVRS